MRRGHCKAVQREWKSVCTFGQHASAAASCKAPASAGLSGLVDMVRLVEAGYGACKSAWVPSGRWEGCPCGAVPPAICCGVMRLTCMPRCDECMQTDGRCCTVCLTTSQPRRNKSE